MDGVLHVSGAPITGAAAALRRLRADGHRIRFVTNSTTRSRAQIGDQLRLMGIEVEDDELQTTGAVAARVLEGKRVLALTMPGLLDDLEGLQLVGMNVEAVPAETVITSTMDDDDELDRLLTLIQSLGLHVVSVEQVVPGPQPPPRGRSPNDRTSDSGSPPG